MSDEIIKLKKKDALLINSINLIENTKEKILKALGNVGKSIKKNYDINKQK